MENTVKLHRALALNDIDDTQLFTFILSIGNLEEFRKNPARSSLFYYQGHEWYLTSGGFNDKEGVPQLGVFLYWTGTNTSGMRCRTDYRIIVRNVQDPAESMISEGLQVLFNPPKSLGWGKRELGPLSDILSVSRGFLVEPGGSIIVELALKSGKTIFEQTVDISKILEEPKQTDTPYKSYFTPNFSLAGFEFYLSVYPFGDREEADGHVSMYLHRYLKTGLPHLGCRIRYRFFIGGHVSPGDSKTFEFSFENDHGYGRFKAFEPLTSTDILRRGPVPVGVEILSITSYAQLEIPLTTRGYYHTDNFVFEDVVFGDHRDNHWKLSVNNVSQVLCFRLDAEDKSKLYLMNTAVGEKEERCSKYLQSQVFVQSRIDKKSSACVVGGPTAVYYSPSLPDKSYSITTTIPVSKAKALDGEYCTKEDPSLLVRVEFLNVQDLPGIIKDYPVLEFERFRLYHTREGLRKCLEQNEQMRREMEKLREELRNSVSNRNQVDDLNLMFPKPFKDDALVTSLPAGLTTDTNRTITSPGLGPVSVSRALSFLSHTVTASAPTSTIPRTHSPTLMAASSTPTAEPSGPAQFVLLPGEDGPEDVGIESAYHGQSEAKIATHRGIVTSTSSVGMRPKANIAQSYVGIVQTTPSKPPTSSVLNAPTSYIKPRSDVDVRPKTKIAQSYVGIVSPTTRTSTTPVLTAASIPVIVPEIRVQSDTDIKPRAGIAQSYVGIVNTPVSGPNLMIHPQGVYDGKHTSAPSTMITSANTNPHTNVYNDDTHPGERSTIRTSSFHDYEENSHSQVTTPRGGFDSSDVGTPTTSSEFRDSSQSISSAEVDIVSGNTAFQKRLDTVEPPVRINHHNQTFSTKNQQLSTKPITISPLTTPTTTSHEHMEQSLKTSHSQKSVQFATELTKEYHVNTKKPISKSKLPKVSPNEVLPSKPILALPKSPTTPRVTYATDTNRPSTQIDASSVLSSQLTNSKKSLANKAWAKPTVFTQIVSQEKRSPSMERKPIAETQVSNQIPRQPHAQILTTGRAPAPQTVSFNSTVMAQKPSATNPNVRFSNQASTLPHKWTAQTSDSSNHPSLEDLHLYTMPDLDLPPALPPRNGHQQHRKEPSRILTTLTAESIRGSPRSSLSLPRSVSGFGPADSQQSLHDRRTFSNQLLSGQLIATRSLANVSPTSSVDTHVSTRSDIQTTFGVAVAETAHTSRQLPQAQVAHMPRRTQSNLSHVGIIETNL